MRDTSTTRPNVQVPKKVGSIGEEYLFLEMNPCACGGDWFVVSQFVIRATDRSGHMVDVLDVRCDRCDQRTHFSFSVDPGANSYRAERHALVNALNLPSSIYGEQGNWARVISQLRALIRRLRGSSGS